MLDELKNSGQIADSDVLVAKLGVTKEKMDAALKSLNVDEFIDLKVIEKRRVELTQEGEGYLKNGSAEVQYINALTKGQETPKTDLKLDDTIAKVGF